MKWLCQRNYLVCRLESLDENNETIETTDQRSAYFIF